MISASLSETILRRIFVDTDSQFATYGFAVSLHSTAGPVDGATEIDGPSYQRALVGHGDAYWTIGARQAANLLEVVFPITGSNEVWPPIRSLGLWDAENNLFLWYSTFTSGEHFIANGDNLFIPAGGMVFGFA